MLEGLEESSPKIKETSFENCTHYWINNGWTKTKNSKPSVKCLFCQKQTTVGKERPERVDYVRKILPYFLKGWAAWRAAEEIGITPKTALRLFRWLNMRVPVDKRRTEPFLHFTNQDPKYTKRKIWKQSGNFERFEYKR